MSILSEVGSNRDDIDFDSQNDGMVTIRMRDSMEQERMKIEHLKGYIKSQLEI